MFHPSCVITVIKPPEMKHKYCVDNINYHKLTSRGSLKDDGYYFLSPKEVQFYFRKFGQKCHNEDIRMDKIGRIGLQGLYNLTFLNVLKKMYVYS